MSDTSGIGRDSIAGFTIGEAIVDAPASSKIHREAFQAVGQAVLSEDEQKGATVHSFDPDASTSQKVASVTTTFASPKPFRDLAGQSTYFASSGTASQGVPNTPGISALPSSTLPELHVLAVDTGLDGVGPRATVTSDGLEAIKRDEDKIEAERVQEIRDGLEPTDGIANAKAAIASVVPGGLSKALMGWLDSAGGTTGTTLADLSDPSASRPDTSSHPLAAYIDPEFYGTVFHNGAIIMFAVLTTRVLTLLRLGWGWTILLGMGCSSYYTLSMERTRSRARDDIQRELVKVRLVTETESADWINALLDRAWLIAEPLLAATIVATVDTAVKDLAVPGLESIRMTTFTLGNKAPRLDSVRTYPMTPDDEVIMEIGLSFTPNDLEDLTPRQAKRKVNPKVVLEVRVGVGVASKGFPILLEDISFTGKLRFKLKLMSAYPFVQIVAVSFMEKPDFDYVLKPIGGDRFGMDVNFVPGLSSFIKEQVHSNLGAMMYDPNQFTINLADLLSGSPLDSAIGVLKVTIESARGLKATKVGGGAPDGYVTLSLGAKSHLVKTKTISSNANPTWSQSLPILVNTLQDVLTLSVLDYNSNRADSLLGVLTHELAGLAQDAEQEGLSGKILSSGKDRGELRYSIAYYPVLTGTKDADGVVTPPPDTSTGIVRLTIHQAKDLDVRKSNASISSSARVFIGSGQQIFRTATIKSSNEPIFEASTEFLVAAKSSSAITIRLQDEHDLNKHSFGHLTVKLPDLLAAKEKGQDWLPLEGVKTGRIRVSAVWKPLLMAGSLDGAADYVPTIGVMRLWIKRAVDLKNVEGRLGGKSDPYVRVSLNNHILARTEVIDNDLNPMWDSIVYVPVHSTRERLLLEVMDFQNLTKDRSLGTVELLVAEYARRDAIARTLHSSSGPQDRSDRIKLVKERTFKGTLFFEATFIPGVNLRGGVSFTNAETSMSPIVDAEELDVRRRASIISTDRGRREPHMGAFPPPETAAPATPHGAVREPGASVAAGQRVGEDNGVRMTQNELLSRQSGVLVVQAISGRLARRGRLEFLLDDNPWPFFGTEQARSARNNTWDQVGEGFCKELDFSRLRLRLNENDDGEQEEIFGECSLSTKEFLEQALNSPATFTLSGRKDNERSTVTLSARYVPVEFALEARESINNMGDLRVDLLSGSEIRGVDRSGKSDPFVTFTLDGQRVYKSAVQKKTLSPTWNEHFTATVISRVGAEFNLEVSDWDRVGTASALGSGTIDLAALEPFQSTEIEVPISTVKNGQQGSVRVRLLFQPHVVVRERKRTTTFSAVGRTATNVGAVPLYVGKGVGKGVIHGGLGVVHKAGDVGAFAGRGLGLVKKRDKSGKEISVQDMAGSANAPEEHNGGAERPGGESYENGVMRDGASVMEAEGSRTPLARSTSRQSSYTAASVLTGNGETASMLGNGAASGLGLLRVTVTRARGLSPRSDPKPYVVISIGKKSHKTGHSKQAIDPEWNDIFSFVVSPDSTALTVSLFDHKTLGKDRSLGSATIDASTWNTLAQVPVSSVLITLFHCFQTRDLLKEGGPTSRWVELGERAGQVELEFEYGEENPTGKKAAFGKNGPGSPFKRRAEQSV